jgi:exoribonuclease-2
VGGTVVERLDVAPAATDSEEESEDEEVAGPIAIAVDISEGESATADSAPAS